MVNSGNTTSAGYALDARYGKTLFDLYTKLNSDLTTHKSSGDHDGRYYTETEINNKIAAITTTSLGAYSNIKEIYAEASSSSTLAPRETKLLKLPEPPASSISGYTLIMAVRAYGLDVTGAVLAGYMGGAPGNDVYFLNPNDGSITFRVGAAYLYGKK